MKHLFFFISISLMLVGCSEDNDTLVKPETPSGLSQTSSDFSSITLEWNASDDAENYSLYRSADGIADFEIIYDGPNTSATDTDLSYANTYYYKISAKNESGESTLSQAVSGSTQIPGGFDITGSPDDKWHYSVDYPFNYLDDFNGKPRYQSDPIGLWITTMASGTWEDLWVIYDQIEGYVIHYHPEITDYPSPTGWLKRLDDGETNILLTPK